MPYLSPGLLAEIFDYPSDAPTAIVVRAGSDDYIQSYFPCGEPVVVEHHRFETDQHYEAVTPDRQLAQRVLWGWATASTDWESALSWEAVELE